MTKRIYLNKQNRRSGPKAQRATVEETANYWWWRFLKCNTDYLKCCEQGGRGKLSQLYADFGDVRGDEYKEWLHSKMESGETRREHLFAEAKVEDERESVVSLNSIADWDQVYIDRGYLLVAINMHERSRASLKRAFNLWLKNEPRAPNRMTAEERKQLIRNRRYELVIKDGVAKRVPRAAGTYKPLPRKEKASAKRGRRGFVIYEETMVDGKLVKRRVASRSTARYPLWQNYSIKNLRDMYMVVQAVNESAISDEVRRKQRAKLVPIYKEFSKLKRYIEHKLIMGDTKDEARVRKQTEKLYAEAREILGDEYSETDIDSILREVWVNRRNKLNTKYYEIGFSLVKQLGWVLKQEEYNEHWLTKKISELYQRGIKVIANTANGQFPKDD